jgi:CubicO group peptidase (beta-lactamase class C family)
MAEIVTRITGVDFKDFLRSAVLDPCGLSHFYVGLSEELQVRNASLLFPSRFPRLCLKTVICQDRLGTNRRMTYK